MNESDLYDEKGCVKPLEYILKERREKMEAELEKLRADNEILKHKDKLSNRALYILAERHYFEGHCVYAKCDKERSEDNCIPCMVKQSILKAKDELKAKGDKND